MAKSWTLGLEDLNPYPALTCSVYGLGYLNLTLFHLAMDVVLWIIKSRKALGKYPATSKYYVFAAVNLFSSPFLGCSNKCALPLQCS